MKEYNQFSWNKHVLEKERGIHSTCFYCWTQSELSSRLEHISAVQSPVKINKLECPSIYDVANMVICALFSKVLECYDSIWNATLIMFVELPLASQIGPE